MINVQLFMLINKEVCTRDSIKYVDTPCINECMYY